MAFGVAATRIRNADPTGLLANRDGVWSWFTDVRALYHEGAHRRVYFGAVARTGSVWVSQYDLDTQTIDTTIVRPEMEIDDHANPSLVMLPDGRLMVFYSLHQGQEIRYRTALVAESIAQWDAERTVTTALAEYVCPFILSGESNKLYAFFKPGTGPTFITSTNEGTSWSAINHMISGGSKPYIHFASNGVDRIDFAYTDKHPDLGAGGIYHAYYTGGSFYKSDGTLITNVAGLPFGTAAMTQVFDGTTPTGRAWIWDIVKDPTTGHPHITYAVVAVNTDHRYYYSRWTGSAWDTHEVCAAGTHVDDGGQGYYSGGIVIDPLDPTTVYLSRFITSAWEIEKRVTADGGATWTTTAITSGSGQANRKNIRPYVVRNHEPGGPTVLWLRGRYESYFTYDTGIACDPPLTLA